MSKIQQEIGNLIEQQAKDLAARLTEIPMWDLKNIHAVIFIYMKNIFIDCINIEKTEIQNEYEECKKILASSGMTKKDRIIAEKRLSQINPKRKRINTIINSLQKEKEYYLLEEFISNKFGKNVLQEFWESLRK